MTYLYERGKARRVMHLANYNRLGEIHGSLCQIDLNLNTAINVPLGRRVCKRCRKVLSEMA